jgi:hypothetical protein
MCGRHTFQPIEAFYRRFNIANRLDALVARYNIAPGQLVPVIIVDGNPSSKLGPLRSGVPIEDWLYVSLQPFKPRLGVPHVCRVKPLDERAVDRREQVGGFGSRALLRPQVIEADGSLPLQRLRLLAAGHAKGLREAGFCLARVRDSLAPQPLTYQPMPLGLARALRCVVHHGQRVSQQAAREGGGVCRTCRF